MHVIHKIDEFNNKEGHNLCIKITFTHFKYRKKRRRSLLYCHYEIVIQISYNDVYCLKISNISFLIKPFLF